MEIAPPYKDSAAAGRYENFMDTSGCSERVYSMVLPPNDGQLEQEDSQEAPADNTVGPAADGEATGAAARHGSGTTAEEGERLVTSQQHPAPGVTIQEAGRYTASAPPRGQLITPTGEPILNPQLGTTLTSYLDNNVRLAIELAQERRALTDQMTSLQVGLETSMKEFEERMVVKLAGPRADQKEEIKYLLRKEMEQNNEKIMKRFESQLENFRQTNQEQLARVEFKTAQAHAELRKMQSEMREHLLMQQVAPTARPASPKGPNSQVQCKVSPIPPAQPLLGAPRQPRFIAINPRYPAIDDDGNIPRKTLEAIKLFARGHSHTGIVAPGAEKDHQTIIRHLGWNNLVEPGSFIELDTAYQKTEALVVTLATKAVVGGPLQRYLNLFSAQLQHHQADVHRRAARAVLYGIACGTCPVAPPDESSDKKKTSRGREPKRKPGFGKPFNVEKALHPWTEATAYQEVIRHCREGHGRLSIHSFSAVMGIYPIIMDGDFRMAFASATKTVVFEADPKLQNEGVSVLTLPDGDSQKRVPQEVVPPFASAAHVVPPFASAAHRGLGDLSLRPSVARGSAWTRPLRTVLVPPRGTPLSRNRPRRR